MTPRDRREHAREVLVELARALAGRGWMVAGLGSLSSRQLGGSVLCTPPDRSARGLGVSQLLEGERALPSLHRLVYERRPEVSIVGLLQPPQTLAATMAGVTVARCLLATELGELGNLGSRTAAPEEALARAAVAALARAEEVLLERYGLLVGARDAAELEARVERIEHAATVTILARQLSSAASADEQQLARLAAGLAGHGLRAGPDCARCNACSLGRRHHHGRDAFADRLDEAIERHLSLG